ncbi:MAG TPA: hypothetical protein VM532_08695 [Burkholderiales bacterium]|nr:hypothetical protein [Burkholderiales bacterium]
MKILGARLKSLCMGNLALAMLNTVFTRARFWRRRPWLRIVYGITSRFGQVWREAMRDARSAVWLFQISDGQRSSAPARRRTNREVIPYTILIPFAFLLLSAEMASAQQQLEIIQLRHRTADQVIPQIDPFVESGGALSGRNNQLFLRATDANRAQIKEIIAAIDRPLRRLMITVKQDSDSRDAERSAEVFGRASIGDNVRIIRPGSSDGRGVTIEQRRSGDAVQARIHGGNSNASGRVSQQVQVIEGGRAFISVGHSLPVPLRSVVLTPRGTIVSDEVVYRDIGTGFYAAPRLSDNMVTLEISPTQEAPGRFGSGSVETQRLSTTVSARLGEWVELGGANQDLSRDRSGTLNYSTRDSVNTRRVLLKVEELP